VSEKHHFWGKIQLQNGKPKSFKSKKHIDRVMFQPIVKISVSLKIKWIKDFPPAKNKYGNLA
jgi:hypothetical protein